MSDSSSEEGYFVPEAVRKSPSKKATKEKSPLSSNESEDDHQNKEDENDDDEYEDESEEGGGEEEDESDDESGDETGRRSGKGRPQRAFVRAERNAGQRKGLRERPTEVSKFSPEEFGANDVGLFTSGRSRRATRDASGNREGSGYTNGGGSASSSVAMTVKRENQFKFGTFEDVCYLFNSDNGDGSTLSSKPSTLLSSLRHIQIPTRPIKIVKNNNALFEQEMIHKEASASREAVLSTSFKQSYFNKPTGSKDSAVDDDLCHICGDGEVSENNDILFCDGCDLCFHQKCCSVPEIPENDWYCHVCSAVIESDDSVTKTVKLTQEADDQMSDDDEDFEGKHSVKQILPANGNVSDDDGSNADIKGVEEEEEEEVKDVVDKVLLKAKVQKLMKAADTVQDLVDVETIQGVELCFEEVDGEERKSKVSSMRSLMKYPNTNSEDDGNISLLSSSSSSPPLSSDMNHLVTSQFVYLSMFFQRFAWPMVSHRDLVSIILDLDSQYYTPKASIEYNTVGFNGATTATLIAENILFSNGLDEVLWETSNKKFVDLVIELHEKLSNNRKLTNEKSLPVISKYLNFLKDKDELFLLNQSLKQQLADEQESGHKKEDEEAHQLNIGDKVIIDHEEEKQQGSICRYLTSTNSYDVLLKSGEEVRGKQRGEISLVSSSSPTKTATNAMDKNNSIDDDDDDDGDDNNHDNEDDDEDVVEAPKRSKHGMIESDSEEHSNEEEEVSTPCVKKVKVSDALKHALILRKCDILRELVDESLMSPPPQLLVTMKHLSKDMPNQLREYSIGHDRFGREFWYVEDFSGDFFICRSSPAIRSFIGEKNVLANEVNPFTLSSNKPLKKKERDAKKKAVTSKKGSRKSENKDDVKSPNSKQKGRKRKAKDDAAAADTAESAKDEDEKEDFLAMSEYDVTTCHLSNQLVNKMPKKVKRASEEEEKETQVQSDKFKKMEILCHTRDGLECLLGMLVKSFDPSEVWLWHVLSHHILPRLTLLVREKEKIEKKLDRASRRDAKSYRELSKLALPYSVRTSDFTYGAGSTLDVGVRQSSRRGVSKVDYTYAGYEESLKDALRY